MMSSSRISHYSDEEDEEWEAVEEEAPPPAKLLLLGYSSSSQATTPTAAEYTSICTASAAKEFASHFKVPPEYDLRAPNSDQRAHSPPAGYAAVYFDHFKSGLTLPLQPFVVSVLNHYKIALAQLHPNGVYNIVGFIEKCEGISVVPTTGLFRHCFTLGRNMKSKGWYTFFARRPGKIVHGQPSCVKHWKESFLFFKTAPMSKNSSLSWNHSPVMNPPLAEDEKPSAETISMLMASAEDSSKRKSADVHRTPLKSEDTSTASPTAVYSRQKRQKRTESPSGPTGKKCVDESSELPSVPGLKDMTTEQFARFIQKSVSSFSLQLQGDKEELEKIVEAKKLYLKHKEKENALLRRDKKELEKENDLLKSKVSRLQDLKDREREELQKVVAAMEHDVKHKDKMITSLKSTLKSVVDDRGPLLKIYTWKLLKTKGFSKFCKDLTKLSYRFGCHVAAQKIQARCPGIPHKAFAGLEDFLAESKLINDFYNMVQDDGFKFPLLDHLLSLPEIPGSSKLKHFNEDEDDNAMIPPPPVPVTQVKKESDQ